ncbi:sensor histidine kinase [Cohnella endophytica]|uniref:histidine kinase n=1 Tax=Cohnella endophytica TaxID=2419778 RepID=A0A494X1A9_9BACL|nr:HAMP domain-containing sensor histidine kinase [Cohnella endophytica]RKP44505.1 sensor histidine kinase [Cohnella endophytica]
MERIDRSLPDAGRMWRNPSLRRLAATLGLVLALAIAFIVWYGYDSAEKLKKEWLDKEAAALGNMAETHPEWAEAWLKRLTDNKDISPDDIAKGREFMERYGMTEEIAADWLPALGEYRSRTFWTLIGAALLLASLAAWLMFREYRRQLSDIRKLALAMEDTVKHNRPMSFRMYAEGELGLLANSAQELSMRLRQTNEQLQQDQTFLKDTVADISHQLKTPLASLMIYIDLLREGNVDPEHTAEFLETCRHELDRMEWLTLTMLKLARLEANALELNIADASLAATVRQALNSIERLAENKQVRIVTDDDGSGREWIIPHDPHWLAEAIGNLLKNAVEHSPHGGLVTIALSTTPVFVRLLIKDEGSGIDARHLPHIFKKFYRTSSAGSGVGLGLPLAKSIVEKHGGILSAASIPSGGSVFSITLPHHKLPAGANASKLTEL